MLVKNQNQSISKNHGIISHNCMLALCHRLVCNGNGTEWSAIWSEIICIIPKLNEHTARVRFEISSMISDQNCTTQSSITTLLVPFWNCTINSLQCKHKNYKILDCTNIKFIFFEPSCQICQTMAFLSFIFLQCDWLV